MIKWLKNTIEAKSIEAENRLKEAQYMGTAMEKIAKESGFVTERPTDGGFQRIMNPQDREKGFTGGDQREMIRQARKMYRFDAHARGILQTMVNYLVGKGFDIKPKSQDPQINYTWWEFWNAPRNNMPSKRFEMILRFFRDGDCIIEFFSKNGEGVETGMSTVRFVDPLLVKNPADGKSGSTVNGGIEVIRNGIEINPNDIEEVVAYWAEDRDRPGQFRKIDADNAIHMKANADSDQRRGETFLQTIMPLIAHYNNWLENRIILNRVRSAIVLIKKVSGTNTELSQIKGNMGPQNAQGQTVIRAGKILIANDGVDYKMESPNINATDVAEDGRNIKLAMSAGTNLPEYIFGDASNANFASTLVAESPFVKAIEYWQIVIEIYMKALYRKVIERAVRAGRLQAPNDQEYFDKLFKVENDKTKLKEAAEEDKAAADKAAADDEAKAAAGDAPSGGEPDGQGDAAPGDPKDKKDIAKGDSATELGADEDDTVTSKIEPPSEIFYGCDLQWPEIVHREPKAQAEALQLARTNGWISDSTASASLGFDYDEEVRKQQKIEENAKEMPNPLLGGVPSADPFGLGADEGDMDAEGKDAMKDAAKDKDPNASKGGNPFGKKAK